MEQGPDIYENAALPISATEVDCVLLTHAHIDHSGKIPFLCKNGFRGKIYATSATMELCSIMLRDSAHIQEFEAAWRNRKAKRAGREEYVPLYTVQDAVSAMEQFVPCSYHETIKINDFISVTFFDAGHLLGSSYIKIEYVENSVKKSIVFSGDIGNTDRPLIKNPEYLTEADYVVMESTYGDRSHGEREDYTKQLVPILQRTFDRGGNVVIPSFAVGRTQELLYCLRQIKQENLIQNHANFPVYLDSPLAVEATGIYHDSMDEYFDEEALELIAQGINPIQFQNLIPSITSEESKAINFNHEPKVIISASGMCEAGRIRHHLKHNLWRPECTILFVGYQTAGTLGRAIIDGKKTVKLFDEEIQIHAEICQIKGISGHADDKGLIGWISSFKEKPSYVFINHGEDTVSEFFASKLRDEYGYNAIAPYNDSVYDLEKGVCVFEGNRTKLEKKARAHVKQNTVYSRLEDAGKRLTAVIRHNEGGSNKDLAKFADQIIALCEKWDR